MLGNVSRRRRAAPLINEAKPSLPSSGNHIHIIHMSHPTVKRRLGLCKRKFLRLCKPKILAFLLLLISISSIIIRSALQNPHHPGRLFVISMLRRAMPAVLYRFRGSECKRYRNSYRKGGNKLLVRRDRDDSNATNATTATIGRELRFGVALQMYPPLDKGWTPEKLITYQTSEKNRIKYCKRHGYKYLNGTHWAEQHPSLLHKLGGRNVWLKSHFIQDILQNNTTTSDAPDDHTLDYILFLDDDAIIMDLDRPLNSLVSDLKPEEGIVVAPEAREDAFINAGGFVIANNAAGLDIIEAWARGAWDGLRHDQPYFNGLFDDEGQLKPWRKQKPNENGIVADKGRAKNNSTSTSSSSSLSPLPRYKLVPPCALQSGGGIEWSPKHKRVYAEGIHARGDFAVHFYGRPDKAEQVQIAARGSYGFIS